MIWPFKESSRKQRLTQLSKEVAQSRNSMYSKLFELDKLDRSLDEMVKRSLELLKPGQKDEPPA